MNPKLQSSWNSALLQEEVEKDIANVEDLEETSFSKEARDAKVSVLTKHSLFDISIQSIVEESIDAVRDIEETEFGAELRDSEAALLKFIMGVRDLKAPEFPKPSKDE